MMSDCDYGVMDGGSSIPNITGGETRTNLIINYLPQSLTDQEFYKIFVVIGPIKNCRIMKDLKTARRQEDGQQDPRTGYSFGFGFVEYQKPEDAAKAILQLNNLPVQHKRIKVSYARPPGEDIKETNLYIQNIPRTYSLDQLDQLFAPFGQIVQKNLLKDKVTGLPRGVGFVRYDKKSEAELAIEQMNGIIPDGGCEPLVVKVAEEHGKMKAAYYAGYHAGLQTTRGGGRGQGFGRGRGNFNNRGGIGFNRGNFSNTGGKMAAERGATRYHPVAANIGNFNGGGFPAVGGRGAAPGMMRGGGGYSLRGVPPNAGYNGVGGGYAAQTFSGPGHYAGMTYRRF